jgi:uncharacterized surface protein with fasciclin (FAS1) repeats
MRKFGLLLVLLATLLLAAVPTFAQDQKTIAEIVVGMAGAADKAEFKTLLAVVQAADPMFLEALSNKEANLTVFAPTDAAFGDLFKALNAKPEDVLKNKGLLDAVLAYHVVPGARFEAAAVTKLNGAILGTVLPENALAVKVDGGKVMINDAEVAQADVAASNGIVHVINKVLVPADVNKIAEEMNKMMEMTPEAGAAEIKSIAGTVVASAGMADKPEFKTLLAAVQAADPMVLKTLDGAGYYTVFAPTDAAFEAALKALNTTADKLLADKATLTNVLAYHVVPGHFSAETVMAVAKDAADGVKVATLLPGSTVTVMVKDGKVMVDGATVVAADVHATNGIIHVIDQVILPPASN